MKDFIRFKPSQRQIYLFERGIVFCKIRMEPSDQGLAPHYSFKKSMKVKGPVALEKQHGPRERKIVILILQIRKLKPREERLTCQMPHNRTRLCTQAFLTPKSACNQSLDRARAGIEVPLCQEENRDHMAAVLTNDLGKYPAGRGVKYLVISTWAGFRLLLVLLSHTSLHTRVGKDSGGLGTHVHTKHHLQPVQELFHRW